MHSCFIPAMILLAASVVSADNIGDGMINWVRSKGGSFNNKVEIRRTDPSDEGSPFGVFAKENLDEKELIACSRSVLHRGLGCCGRYVRVGRQGSNRC